MSLNQLKALWVLVNNSSSVVEAIDSADTLGLTGKALGGVFSSLSRQQINGESLVEPFGRSAGGRGLRWKLNQRAMKMAELRALLKEVLEL